ncbi:MAG: AraC family transcriptional regulator [Undibacterium sp.]|uniref:AraC family transcriptional regulator n=1 Tax=Undibacterium sp. TaxID=1914977 RepID=UPI002715AD7A|nr:AraC family transcriptional regulator [Undibacterium sp.]MDO8651982.1 AraC family transcriptional regulator [Undibacterium sp.]
MPALLDDPEPMTRDHLASQIKNVFFTEALFDAMPDVVFFVKDREGRYIVVNQTLVDRSGVKYKQALLGSTAAEVFPSSLAVSYEAQDQLVLSGETELRDQLELHLYPDRDPGWCLTQKIALFDKKNNIIGLTGISRDLAMPDQRHPVYHRIAAAVRHLHSHYGEAIHMADLAQITALSVAQIERYFQKIFSLTPRQMIIKIRLDAASSMLADPAKNITDIAAACGYQDHSAFSRVFKSTVGMTPSEYRLVLLNKAD